jgi:hypothetical protein
LIITDFMKRRKQGLGDPAEPIEIKRRLDLKLGTASNIGEARLVAKPS